MAAATLGVIHGVAFWPGVESFLGATYTLSHGISPGVCILRCAPQETNPELFGDLVIGDGNEEVTLPDCTLRSMRIDRDGNGFFWVLEIVDRRWRWGQMGKIDGCYNQMTPFGKLIPWLIRSPTELAKLCLEVMQETDYELDLPSGIDYPGPNVSQPIINISGVNPPVDWHGIPPAQALQQLADRCGCRIIYRWKTDSILISPVGVGKALPPGGSIAKRLANMQTPMAPSEVGVQGAPTRFQMRLQLTAVGKEWDGSYWPINLLSYAPLAGNAGQKQITNLNLFNLIANTTLIMVLTDGDGVQFPVQAQIGATNLQTTTLLLAAIETEQLHGADVWREVEVTASADGLVFTGVEDGLSFALSAAIVDLPVPLPDPAPQAVIETVQEAVVDTLYPCWDRCYPPEYQGVRSTERLTLQDAQRLAQESVFRCYQLAGVDVENNGPPYVPGYGTVDRTMQLILQSTQVDQIVPVAVDRSVVIGNPSIMPPDWQGGDDESKAPIPLTVNFYSGYSQDKPAAVYGSIAKEIIGSHLAYLDADGTANADVNTPPGAQVHVPFTVNAEWFMVVFSTPIYAFGERPPPGVQGDSAVEVSGEGALIIPNLVLQTAVMVRDNRTNQLVRYERVRDLEGGDPRTAPVWRNYQDIQANITSTYDENNILTGYRALEDDPDIRAKHYLDGMVREFQYKNGQTVEYNGIRAIDVDGLTWQVTWSIDDGGCATTATQNGEHSIWIPPYKARRRAEYLQPVAEPPGGRVNVLKPAHAGPLDVILPYTRE